MEEEAGTPERALGRRDARAGPGARRAKVCLAHTARGLQHGGRGRRSSFPGTRWVVYTDRSSTSPWRCILLGRLGHGAQGQITLAPADSV